jgi:DDE_Tnp_1-associated
MVMERTAGDTGALGEAIVFLDYFKDLPDPRQRGKVLYPLDEVLLGCLLAALVGSEAITDIARFGEKKLELIHLSAIEFARGAVKGVRTCLIPR